MTLRKDTSIGDLSPQEQDDSLEIEFEIDEDMNEDDEDLEIILLGEDENGAKHGENWEISLDIERETHEIGIRKVTVHPETVLCEKETEISVDIRNTGRRGEDEVYLRIYNSRA